MTAVRVLLKMLPDMKAANAAAETEDELHVQERPLPALPDRHHDRVTTDAAGASRCYFCWRPWKDKLYGQVCAARLTTHTPPDIWLIGYDLIFCWQCGVYIRTRTQRLAQSCPRATTQLTLLQRLRSGCEPTWGGYIGRPHPVMPAEWLVIDDGNDN